MKQIPFLILAAFAFYGVDCRREDPCLTCPTPAGDALITFERELADGEQPAVSPDGKKIAYTHNGDIFVMDTSVQTTVWWDGQNWRYDTTGGAITQLTSGAEIDILPRWAPDGQTVGFVRLQTEKDDNGMICTVPSTGGGVTQIPLDHLFSNKLWRFNERSGAIGMPMLDFSLDGKYLAFLSQENDTNYLNVIDFLSGQEYFRKGLFSDFEPDMPGFAWSFNNNEIAFIVGDRDSSGGRATRARLINFLTNDTKQDSLVLSGNYLSRTSLLNSFVYSAYESSIGRVILISDFSSNIKKIIIPPIPSPFNRTRWRKILQMSPNTKFLTYCDEIYVGGPFGYQYLQVYLYDIETQKEYLLIKESNVNKGNYSYEWGKSSDAIFFERFKKINKIIFQIP